MDGKRVWAEIDLEAIRRNFDRLQRRVERHVMVVLKADAYGLGAVPIARTVEQAGAAMIGVGDSTEALELRRAGVRVPIVVLGAIVDGEIEAVLRYRVSVTIHSRDRLESLVAMARALDVVACVHLMVDTGMGRLGSSPAHSLELLQQIHEEPRLRLEGVATHFSTPSDPDFTREQLMAFQAVLRRAREAGLPTGICHAAASAALWHYPGTHLDMVRPGILIHGIDPGGLGLRAEGYEQALELKTQVIYLKTVPAGTPIGYQRAAVTRAPTRVATIPVGYNDGLPLTLSNQAEVLCRGQRARLLGRVSMDYAMVDVTHVEGVSVGDTVTLIGRDGRQEIGVEELADRAGTIPHAIGCGLGKRVRRRYIGERPATQTDEVVHKPQRLDFAGSHLRA